MKDLSAAGYGAIAPDYLGYGNSDMPIKVKAYNLKTIGGRMMEVLHNEGVNTVVGVGHDLGTKVPSRTNVWYPDRFETCSSLFWCNLATCSSATLTFSNSYDTAKLAAEHEDKKTWMATYSKPNATGASMNYYKTLLRGVQAKDEEVLIDEDRMVKVPVLAIAGSRDLVTRAEQMGMITKAFAQAGYTDRVLNA
ncbi:epoxide hydrolase 2 [Fusarium beomiforme]|uniref:Epoxide hydrolase 2 n=1 Tax=Fusarium beomiforme TaxID=44412 RepID=A0A9P5ANR2_9HYPO|nr:epoxide hydrolase 2 [Fusarium beomiforme]